MPAPSPAALRRIFVSPLGDDAGTGEEARPFRTLSRALGVEAGVDAEIWLAPGEYVEPEVVILRPVAIRGSESGRSSIVGQLLIHASSVSVRGLSTVGGISITNASSVTLASVRIEPHQSDDALSMSRATASLLDLEIACGVETCLQVSSSTVTLIRARLIASLETRRLVRAETSSVTAIRLRATGGSINQILAIDRARVRLAESDLEEAGGSAIAVMGASTMDAERVTIGGAERFGLLVQSSHARFREVVVGSTNGIGVGIAGGDVDLFASTIERSSEAALSVSGHAGRSSNVRLIGARIRHGDRPGLLLSQGRVSIEDSAFVGQENASNEDADAILASGVEAELALTRTTIDAPRGFGVSLHENATGTVTATISRPRLGGILVENAAGGDVLIRGVRIGDCASGSGLAVHNATQVNVVDTRVTGCPEAGLLAGQDAVVAVEGSGFVGNGRYGIAAFGGAIISVEHTMARGSRWATFSTCGDGARVEDAGGNTIEGPTIVCP